jgi:hypothetical protein
MLIHLLHTLRIRTSRTQSTAYLKSSDLIITVAQLQDWPEWPAYHLCVQSQQVTLGPIGWFCKSPTLSYPHPNICAIPYAPSIESLQERVLLLFFL